MNGTGVDGAGGTSSDRNDLPLVAIGVAGVVVGGGAAGIVLVETGVVSTPWGFTSRQILNSPRDGIDWFVAPFRHSSWNDEDPLENDKRDAVYTAIEDQRGNTLTLAALAETTDMPRSTVRKNAHILVQAGYLGQEHKHNERCYYLANGSTPSPVVRRFAQASHSDALAKTIVALRQYGPLSVADVARATDRSSGTVSPQLRRLEDDGIVESERSGRSKRYDLSSDAEQLDSPDRDS